MLNFCDFIQAFVFITNHQLKTERKKTQSYQGDLEPGMLDQ